MVEFLYDVVGFGVGGMGIIWVGVITVTFGAGLGYVGYRIQKRKWKQGKKLSKKQKREMEKGKE